MKELALSTTDVITIGLIMKYGKPTFNLTEAAEILSRNPNGLAAYLHEHGITVERRGTKKGSAKYVLVTDLAQLVADKSKNVAAIRSD